MPQQKLDHFLKTLPSDVISCELPDDLPIPLTSGMTFVQMIARLKQVFQSSIGYEYDHVEDDKERAWFREQVFTQVPFSKNRKRASAISLVCGGA